MSIPELPVRRDLAAGSVRTARYLGSEGIRELPARGVVGFRVRHKPSLAICPATVIDPTVLGQINCIKTVGSAEGGAAIPGDSHMALQGAISVQFGAVFPDGAYAAGSFEMVRDFDRSTADRPVQQVDIGDTGPCRCGWSR